MKSFVLIAVQVQIQCTYTIEEFTYFWENRTDYLVKIKKTVKKIGKGLSWVIKSAI